MKPNCVSCKSPLKLSNERYERNGNYCDQCCLLATRTALKKLGRNIPSPYFQLGDNDDQWQ